MEGASSSPLPPPLSKAAPITTPTPDMLTLPEPQTICEAAINPKSPLVCSAPWLGERVEKSLPTGHMYRAEPGPEP